MKQTDKTNKTNLILKEIKKALSGISKRKTKKLVNEIAKANEVNVIGHGRSWHAGKSFAMRLTHLGLDVGRLGKKPGKTSNKDLTLIISGSGESKDILKLVKSVKKGKIVCITMTGSDDSSIAKKADLVIEIKARRSKQPLRSLFEQSALIYLDSIVMLLMEKMNISEKEMWKRHD
ncbi:SIS domain-containing protein [Candidatus Pacearchaeota archaeon]|nr:SIS domain-containing protein [Candidatus Pacearchaeota archaeon]